MIRMHTRMFIKSLSVSATIDERLKTEDASVKLR
jgi:hypothetical protein